MELTLAHQLKRSAGALRTHLGRIRKGITPEDGERLQREFIRVEEEVAFQADIAEKTRLWHQLPSAARDTVNLSELVTQVAAPLRDRYRQVTLDYRIDPAIEVLVNRDGLREVLHSLIENAFHAVFFTEGLADPRVQIWAAPEADGKTVRVDVMNNGIPVPTEDRERIFDPRVTTKKGGEGRPLGSGMGLAIARRYAGHMGGQVGIDSEQEMTCFYARFVAATRE